MSEPTASQTQIEPAQTPSDLAIARMLFLEYQQSLGIDLCFQNFDQELAGLPGDYAEPLGGLLVAQVDGEPAGCCAFRPLLGSDYPNACEMKRLYVRRMFRGFGLGRQLAERTLMLARQAGYDHILLDTLDDMEAARALYLELGFTEVAPYYHNPLAGAHYLKADLK
ncbi:GNAT family N-acetyltransferase [Hydrogenophaga defluvii]|uniref:GNAT family N-acetyltransferase n=2 Tax=Hydrogenophaga TaxID=47420 RepID=A0ABW2SFK3_9BURK